MKITQSTYCFTYRLLLAIIAMIMLNTLTVYEVSKWAVLSHHAKVWIEKKENHNTQKKLLFLDNKILTKKQIFAQKTDNLIDNAFVGFSFSDNFCNFSFFQKNNFSLFSFSTTLFFVQNDVFSWKMFLKIMLKNSVVSNAP